MIAVGYGWLHRQMEPTSSLPMAPPPNLKFVTEPKVKGVLGVIYGVRLVIKLIVEKLGQK